MCKDCLYGGKMLGFRGSAYEFKRIFKVNKNNENIAINYSENEYGCRMTQWNDKEELCISSNFSQFVPLNF